jgi:hypothetical protein
MKGSGSIQTVTDPDPGGSTTYGSGSTTLAILGIAASLRCGFGRKKFVLRNAGAEPQAGEMAGANPAAARALFNRQSMTAPRR